MTPWSWANNFVIILVQGTLRIFLWCHMYFSTFRSFDLLLLFCQKYEKYQSYRKQLLIIWNFQRLFNSKNVEYLYCVLNTRTRFPREKSKEKSPYKLNMSTLTWTFCFVTETISRQTSILQRTENADIAKPHPWRTFSKKG